MFRLLCTIHICVSICLFFIVSFLLRFFFVPIRRKDKQSSENTSYSFFHISLSILLSHCLSFIFRFILQPIFLLFHYIFSFVFFYHSRISFKEKCQLRTKPFELISMFRILLILETCLQTKVFFLFYF